MTDEQQTTPKGMKLKKASSACAVTAEMTSAGLAVLKAELGDDYSQFAMAHQVLSRVFRAMVSASRA